MRLLVAILFLFCFGLFLSGCCSDDEMVVHYPPVAAVTATPDTGIEPLDTVLDASGSTDSDGTIVQYDWDYDSDGTYDLIDGGVSVPYTYDPYGTYTATVRVFDNDGMSDTAFVTITVGELDPPTAVGEGTPQGIGSTVADLDASESFDTDGTVVQYDWDMDNDGTYEIIDGGPTPTHDFGAFGTFTVGVRVTDDDGLTDEGEITVTLTEAENVPPVADVMPSPASGDTPLDVTWDASGSTDSDGTIVQYDWDMDNDGTFEITDGGVTQAANYTAGGSYTVGVRVTDDDGAIDTATAVCEVNEPPVADVVPSPASGNAPLDVIWDASGSTDSDGTIVQYDWDMDNDGTFEITDGGTTQAVNYAAGGVYTVGVRVTDDDGATDTATADCDVNNPPLAALTNTFEEIPQEERFEIHWDAAGSSDSDGSIVTYDWDMDNDGTYEILDGGATQDMDYTDWSFMTVPVVGVRVTDDDGAQGSTTASTLFPPLALLSASPLSGTAPLDITWDASASWDPDGGSIVQYDFDLDADDTYEYMDQGATLVLNYTTAGFHVMQVRVTDDEGETDTLMMGVSIS